MRTHFFPTFLVLFTVLIRASLVCFAQEDKEGREVFTRYIDNCYSNEDCQPCIDTLRILGFKRINDIGIMLPAWKPVVDNETVTILEGNVIYGGVSSEDLPLYHYTHDFAFNVIPDERSRGLLTYYTDEKGKNRLVRDYIHVEWESGLAASNKGNYCTQNNIIGNSCGFASSGHERYDHIWNWPTIGDWVHVEGLWVFDRGHPPAKTEIHPVRFMATRRALPDKVKVGKDEGSREVYATRIDMYANGNGGAFNNNLPFAEDFVHKVRMSSKNYRVKVEPILPKPSSNSQLRGYIVPRKGDTYTGDVHVEIGGESATIMVNWKSDKVLDTAILAQTVYLYWDEGNGVPVDYEIGTYKVTLNHLRIKTFSDILNRSELRMFSNVGSNYIFLNEWLGGEDDILNKKFGKARKRKYDMDISFTLYVPKNEKFRVMAKGWEADGVNKLFGQIMNQNLPCTKENRKFIKDKMMDWTPVGWGGCMDDFTGMAEGWHVPSKIDTIAHYEIHPVDGLNGDFCPMGDYSLKDYFRLHYKIEKLD